MDRVTIEAMRRGGPLGALVVILVAGMLAPGCTYHEQELETFLIKPPSEVSGTEYRVYPPDSISIRSVNVPEINGFGGRLRPDGKINLPLLKEVYIAGLTPREIEETLVKASKEFYEEADATVQVTGYSSQFFYIFGQVATPGPKAWTGRDTLLDAMAKANPQNTAWQERIIVIRAPKPHVGGFMTTQPAGDFHTTGIHDAPRGETPRRMIVNLYAMIREGDFSHNILLKPNDVVYVQPTPLAWIGLTLNRLLFPVSPITSAISAPSRIAAAGG